MPLDDTRPAVPTQELRILFLLGGQLHEMMFNPHLPDGLSVHLGEPGVEVALTGVSHPITYRAQTALACTAEQFEFVQALIGKRYLLIDGAPISLPHRARDEEVIASDGSIAIGYGLRQQHLPPSIVELIVTAQAQLSDAVSKLVRIFRWAQKVDAPHNAFSSSEGGLYWQTDPSSEGQFHGVPLKSNAQTVKSPVGIRWKDDDKELIHKLLKSDVEEPLAHEILREGIALWPTAPRSSLLQLNSALEIGVKQHIAVVAPATAWLLEEMPSPPMHKVLRRYLPTLHESRTDIPWESLKRLCKDAQTLAEKRNDVAHAGRMPIDFNIEKFADVVQDWLYILDLLRGHDWAADFVSHTTRSELGWPPSKHKTMLVQILPEQ